MKGISVRVTKALEKIVEGVFDSLSLNFLGIKPKVTRSKKVIFSTSKNSITSLFLEALETNDPTQSEEDTLKVLLRVSQKYIDALKNRTQAKVINSVDSYVRNKNLKKEQVVMKEVRGLVTGELDKAKNHFKMIANTESNKAGNIGSALQISKMAKQFGEDDPTVFFSVIVDDVTGPEEFILHLLPDKKTPRVWKLSEIGSEYHKKGDSNPKFPGLHPNCRCKLVYLAPGWGFNEEGRIKSIGLDHNEFESQRKTYGLPR